MSKNVVVLGTQWGDEGKGKIVDYLAREYGISIAARFNGGNNAGHCVESVTGERQSVHVFPSCAFIPGMSVAVGRGMVVDPEILLAEMTLIEDHNQSATILIDGRAHVISNSHKAKDAAEEEAKGDKKIGTCKTGNGPAYADKMSRVGKRIIDLINEDPAWNRAIGANVTDVSDYLNKHLGEGIMFAGAHGIMLDIDSGTYPFVTSSNCTSSAVGSGAGVDPRYIDEVWGVTKAYCTRIGSGPFPTEMDFETAGLIRTKGKEFGTTTGRPRRVGWLDGPALRHAASICKLDFMAVTLLDVLSEVDYISIATGYLTASGRYRGYPMDAADFEKIICEYEVFPGWKGVDISGCKHFRELPVNAQWYLLAMQKITGVPLGLVSVGPRQDQTINMREGF